ncbi:group II intron maturase-specific domain-containing protein [Jeotgalibacillus salarius]|uniref:group II intron maturase-specific domain-containing protein n=1 Tax=Jeotgalibacillus salarius TaxID=546023 RepID=UPI001FC8B16A|nr:group II intron maturase-specific domain-containing protein [Jeotgalibacillus salarius]
MQRYFSHFLRIQYSKTDGKVGCRPDKSAKQRFKNKLKKLTSRKRAGTWKQIMTDINRVTVGWINYYGIARMKTFIQEIQGWLNHRLRQIIWKRWKKVKTKYKKLRKYGIGHEDAMRLANSRKGYWRISSAEVLHRAITKEKLTKWGLKNISALYELRYLKG